MIVLQDDRAPQYYRANGRNNVQELMIEGYEDYLTLGLAWTKTPFHYQNITMLDIATS